GALQSISQPTQAMAPASSLLTIDNAAKAQRAVREKLQEFEHSQARTKDKRT
ncbi:hypothetical protein BGZ70_001878, partial [Mortierella alpina]